MDNIRLDRILLDHENFKEENINKIILEKRLADKYQLIREKLEKLIKTTNLRQVL